MQQHQQMGWAEALLLTTGAVSAYYYSIFY
jgi:hypothetical protein